MKRIIASVLTIILVLGCFGILGGALTRCEDECHAYTYDHTESPYECSKTVYYKCAVCGEVKSVDIEYGSTDDAVKVGVVTISPHNIVEVAETKATCTSAGYTAGTKCSVCGKVFSGLEKAEEALGHTTYIKNYKEATNKEDGYSGDEYCSICGELIKEGNIIPKIEEEEDSSSNSFYSLFKRIILKIIEILTFLSKI